MKIQQDRLMVKVEKQQWQAREFLYSPTCHCLNTQTDSRSPSAADASYPSQRD